MYNTVTYTAINAPFSLAQTGGVLRLLEQMFALRKQRQALAKLDDIQLRDMGLTYAQAQAEAARPMWDFADRRA